jgi:hypothetical protein
MAALFPIEDLLKRFDFPITSIGASAAKSLRKDRATECQSMPYVRNVESTMDVSTDSSATLPVNNLDKVTLA